MQPCLDRDYEGFLKLSQGSRETTIVGPWTLVHGFGSILVVATFIGRGLRNLDFHPSQT